MESQNTELLSQYNLYNKIIIINNQPIYQSITINSPIVDCISRVVNAHFALSRAPHKVRDIAYKDNFE